MLAGRQLLKQGVKLWAVADVSPYVVHVGQDAEEGKWKKYYETSHNEPQPSSQSLWFWLPMAGFIEPDKCR